MSCDIIDLNKWLSEKKSAFALAFIVADYPKATQALMDVINRASNTSGTKLRSHLLNAISPEIEIVEGLVFEGVREAYAAVLG